MADGKPDVTIDCKGKHESDIVKALFNATGAKQLPINPEDSKMATEYLRDKERRIQAKINLKVTRAAKKEEARLLGTVA